MAHTTNDDSRKRELSIGELETVAAGGFDLGGIIGGIVGSQLGGCISRSSRIRTIPFLPI